MRSYDVTEHGQPLQARLRATPVPQGKEVLLRVTHAGVCHSDVHLWHGWWDLGGGRKALLSDRGLKLPLTLGHEPLGIVADVGGDVRSVRTGDKRLVYPWLGCGTCWACEEGLTTLCAAPRTIGIGLPGAFATHLLVPDERFLVDVSGVDDAFAATLACAGVTSYSAIAKVLPHLRRGDAIAIIGCGGLGLLAISILNAMGFTRIIACDVDPAKLETAREQGATVCIRADASDASSELHTAADKRLAAAIDFVGQPRTLNLAYPSLRKGGVYVLVGLHGGELSLPMPPIAQRSISIMGSFTGTLDDLKAVVALAKGGGLRPPPLVVRPPEEVTQALVEMDERRSSGRTVLDFSREEG